MAQTKRELTNCEAWARWTRAKWRELNKDWNLGKIEQVENLWLVEHNDTSRVCPYCGHVLYRPKSHTKVAHEYRKPLH